MENQQTGFGYFFDKSLKTLKNNLFVLLPNLIFYIITGIVSIMVMVPLFTSISENPYAFMNKFSSNIGALIGGYIVFLLVIILTTLFIESGNMYMIKRIVEGKSNGLSDFISGLTKYPHKLFGFGLVMFVIGIAVYMVLILLILLGFKVGAFLSTIIGIALFIFAIFIAIVFQPYDAVMALGDNGPIDTISKTFKFGKSNFLPLFLLGLISIIVSILFQGATSATTGISAFGNSSFVGANFNIVTFIIVYSIQMIVGIIIKGFNRIFKFHLYHEYYGLATGDDNKDILNDYIASDFKDSNYENQAESSTRVDSQSALNLDKKDDPNN